MKRFAVLITGAFLFAAAFPLTSQAQMGETTVEVKPGVRAGVNSMILSGDDTDDLDRRTGFMVGGFALVDFAGPFALQPELMYVQKGATQEESIGGTTITGTTKLDYIEIPVLAKVQLPVQGGFSPHLFAGPTLGFTVTAEAKTEGGGESETEDLSDEASETDVGLALGGGLDVNLAAGTLMIDVRYGLGLSNIDDTEGDQSVNNQGYMITVGFAF